MCEQDLKQRVWDVLSTIQDPEVRLDVVNLGLVYKVDLKAQGDGFEVVIDMTLTSPTCSMAPYIFQQIHEGVALLDKVEEVTVNLVWDPPWSKDKISEMGKMELGLL